MQKIWDAPDIFNIGQWQLPVRTSFGALGLASRRAASRRVKTQRGNVRQALGAALISQRRLGFEWSEPLPLADRILSYCDDIANGINHSSLLVSCFYHAFVLISVKQSLILCSLDYTYYMMFTSILTCHTALKWLFRFMEWMTSHVTSWPKIFSRKDFNLNDNVCM